MANLSKGIAAAALIAVVAATIHVSAQGRAAEVAIGSTDAPAPRLRGALRHALSEELTTAEDVHVVDRRRASYVLRAAVTRMDLRRDGQRNRLECEVSVTVEERRTGAVRMMLAGRAMAAGTEVEHLRGNVLRAAVRGAVRPLGESLLSQQR